MLAVSQNVFAYAPVVPAMQPMRAARSSVNMGVADMPGVSTETGNKVWDPLGLGADEAALYRRRVVEIKHGRICMVAFLGMTVGPNDVRRAPHPPLGERQRACRCTAAAAADADAP